MTGVPLRADSDRATVRVIALIALLLAAGATTHGYLPGAVDTPREWRGDAGAAELIALTALLAVSSAVLGVAAVQRARRRSGAAGGPGRLPSAAGVGNRRPLWQIMLIVAGMLALWLLVVLVSAKFAGGYRLEFPTGAPSPSEAAPAVPGAPLTTAPSHPSRSAGTVSGYLVAAATVLLVLTAVAVIAARARRPDPGAPAVAVIPSAAGETSAGETLVRAAELGLTRVADPSRGPRQAIIACYAVMEHHLSTVPDVAPRDFDTPTEVLARAVEHHALSVDGASRLVELFTEARFSTHLMTEQHRADAVDSLRTVLDELRAVS